MGLNTWGALHLKGFHQPVSVFEWPATPSCIHHQELRETSPTNQINWSSKKIQMSSNYILVRGWTNPSEKSMLIKIGSWNPKVIRGENSKKTHLSCHKPVNLPSIHLRVGLWRFSQSLWARNFFTIPPHLGPRNTPAYPNARLLCCMPSDPGCRQSSAL